MIIQRTLLLALFFASLMPAMEKPHNPDVSVDKRKAENSILEPEENIKKQRMAALASEIVDLQKQMKETHDKKLNTSKFSNEFIVDGITGQRQAWRCHNTRYSLLEMNIETLSDKIKKKSSELGLLYVETTLSDLAQNQFEKEVKESKKPSE